MRKTSPKTSLSIALGISVLVHGLVLSVRNPDSGDGVSDRRPSVTVRVELVKQRAEASVGEHQRAPQVEQVVDVERNSPAVPVQKTARQETVPRSARTDESPDADIRADYADRGRAREYRDAGERADQLKRYVFQAINREKYYPFMARRRGREGLVKLNFIMHPDGKVTDIAVVQSSRFSVLDDAARQAVAAISPFKLAAQYLEAQHRYNVDIEFRLN